PVQTAPPVVDEDPFTMTMNFDSPAGRPAVEEDIEPSAEPQVTHHDFEVEVPGTAQSPAAPIEDLQEPEPPVVTAAQGPPPMPVALPPRSPVGGIVARMRDALAVRMALLRGEGALDPDIQIVSGAGAPARRRQPAGPLPESEAEFEEVELPSQPQPQPQPQPVAVGAVAESFEPMEFEPMDAIGDEELDIPDRWLNEPQRAEAAGRPAVLPVPIRPPAPVAPSHEPQPEPHDIDDSPGAPPPGRHMRSVLGGTGRPSWLSLEPIRQAMRDVSRSREPGVAIAGRDSRLWVFGGAVLIILLVGVLTGKSVSTPSSSNTAAHSHGTATTPVQQVPTAAPTTIATPTAAPTPPPAAVLPALTGAHTLGSGATQYGVNGIRYGVHPGDYRIVFDLGDTTGAGGAPTVTLGIGPGGTALYVEFNSVTPSGQPATPSAGGVVTGATLMLPSPAGKTVYRFSLQHSATVSAYYLFNATRLVIDLT
ncbi:MAG: hypothetical protein JOZ92_01785, partial [Candidatus Dormibacteraeota bacterium]|nr:hypothetical protein [Candidatus Dormibacteraeota bacterium]